MAERGTRRLKVAEMAMLGRKMVRRLGLDSQMCTDVAVGSKMCDVSPARPASRDAVALA
jgi:hypothetical protein